MKKHLLVIGIVFLFFISAVAPMTTGLDTDTSEVDVELERMLDNLRFMCMGPDGLIIEKYEYYKEQLLSMYSTEELDNDVVVESDNKESITSVEQPSIPIASSGGPMDSPWPMHGHDVHHTGQSPYSTADNPYDEKWKFQSDWGIPLAPAIDNNGIIYIGSGWEIIAVNSDGTEKWRYETNGLLLGSSPAIAEDGTVYVGSWDWFLYALNPDGTLKWRVQAGGIISSSPAIAEDGTIYIGQTETDIVAINPNGTIKWKYNTGQEIFSDPTIGDDGTIYCGSNDNYLYAMNPDGTLKWKFKTGKAVCGSSIGEDGTIYVGGVWDNWFYALYPNNGTIKWRCNIKCNSNPSIDSNGIIYIAGTEKLWAVYPNGTIKWTFNLGNERWTAGTCPAISADGTIYVSASIGISAGGDIIAVNPNGTLRWRKKISTDWVHSSPAIAEDGTVYIGAHHMIRACYLYAFGRAELEVDANGPYYGLVDDPLQFIGTSSGGYLPHSYLWEFGDTYTSEEQNPMHTYTSSDNYDVILTVTDNKSNTVIDTTFAWIQTTNTEPDKPTIHGTTNGDVGVTYGYNIIVTDPDESIIYLYVDWGDETNTGWIGPYNSGVTITKSHKWTNQGTYTIKAKAKDPYNDEGPWGELQVTMPRDKATNNVLFWRLIGQFPMLERLYSLFRV